MDVLVEDEVLIARDKTKLLSGGPSTGGGIDVVEDDVEDDEEPTLGVPLPPTPPPPPPLPPIG